MPAKFEFLMQYLGHAYTEALSITDVKLGFRWAS